MFGLKEWQSVFVKKALRIRREHRRLTKLGYIRHETDWEIHRGGKIGHVIVDAKVSCDGMYVYTLLGRFDFGGDKKMEPKDIRERKTPEEAYREWRTSGFPSALVQLESLLIRSWEARGKYDSEIKEEIAALKETPKIGCAVSEQEIEIRRYKVAPYFLYVSPMGGREQHTAQMSASWFPEIKPGETRKAKIVLEVKQ